MKTHFISLVGLDFDRDLLPYWIDYYAEYQFDVYRVWLHVNGDTPDTPHPDRAVWQRIFERAGYGVEQAYGKFDNGRMRTACLKPYHRAQPAGDYIICADSDEFQVISPEEYRELFDIGIDVIEGELQERYDRTLHDPIALEAGDVVRVPLWVQYPNRGKMGEVVMQSHPHAGVSRRKILAAKASVIVSYMGSHRVEGSHYRRASNYIVDHYTCRESYLRRMGGKSYFHETEILDVARFFGITDPQDERISWLYDRLKKRIDRQGWIPTERGSVLAPQE